MENRLQAIQDNTTTLRELENPFDLTVPDYRGNTITVNNEIICILVKKRKQSNKQMKLKQVDAHSNKIKN